MTWNELIARIQELSPEQKNETAQVYLSTSLIYRPICEFYTDETPHITICE